MSPKVIGRKKRNTSPILTILIVAKEYHMRSEKAIGKMHKVISI